MEKQKRIKIAYFITGLNAGGAETVVYNLVQKLDRERYEALAISILRPGIVGNRLRKISPVLSLNARSKYDPVILWRLYGILRREKPHILHTHLFHADLIGRIVGRLAGVPIIISTVHNTNIGGRMRELLLRCTSRMNDADVAVSDGVAEHALTSRVSSKSKLRVIRNGIDTELFSKKDKRAMRENLGISGAPVIVNVASLTRQKGHTYLLKAFAQFRKKYRDAVLLILGTGSELSSLEDLSRELGIERSVKFLGIKENVPDYLSAADMFVLASLWEGLPLVVAEAMSCELPVVATRFAAAPEIINDGVNGFLVPPGDARALLEKMHYVLELSPERRREISVAARETIVQKFSIENMIKGHERLYETFLQNNT